MKFFTLSLGLWLVSFVVSAQNGNYFLSHYSPKQENIDHFSFDIVQDNKGILFFANKAGVLQFDGRNWLLIDTPGPIYSLSMAGDDQVFVGGLSGFGRLIRKNGDLTFESLSADLPKAQNIFQSVALKDKVYFLSHQELFEVDAATGKIVRTIPATTGSYNGIFELNGEVYIDLNENELLKLSGNGLIKSQINPAAGSVLFSHQLPGKETFLLGTSEDRLFTVFKNDLKEIVLKDADYLQRNVLISGAWISESLVALGTLRGGVLFINPQSGETTEIINYYTGLPDNEVFALMADQSNGIWVAHDYGFTRIAPYVPFRSFSHYPGLEGNLLCAYSFGNSIYVGTTLGLYKLEKDEIYSEETYYVTKVKGNKSQQETIIEQHPDEVQKVNKEKVRKGLFGRKKKAGETVQEAQQAAAATPDEKNKPQPITTKEKRTRKILVGLQFRYKKVEGMTGKVTHLVKIEGELYAAGLDGVYKVNGLKSAVVTNEPVHSIFLSPSLNQLFISTYNEELKSFKNKGGQWTETHLLDTLREYVSYMFEDKLQNIWLCGRAGALKVEMLDGQIVNIDRVQYLRPSIDETVGLAVGSDVYVVNAGEFQRYQAAKNNFIKYDSLPGTRKYFASAGSFWFHDGHRWRTVDQKLARAMQLEWLGLFSDIRYLTPTEDLKSLWVISASNELYRFSPEAEMQQKGYPLFLRDIRGPKSTLEQAKLELEEDQSSLTFEFIQPDYVGMQSIEYRYMVSGISESWTDWSPENNVVTFPYLPSGEYEIQIQSKNLFGKVNEIDKIYFSVLPPYWKRPWFYALEFAFFSLLVVLSVRLGVSNSRLQPVSKVLTLLTVIMFIEMVQTTIYSFISTEGSPVIEFLIQVLIALMVLPLEVRLRNFMEHASQGKYDLSKIIKSKKPAEAEMNEV